jgi:hypothetical protein
VVCDLHQNEAEDHYHMIHTVLMQCLRKNLERRAAAGEAADMEREQERILAEEGAAVRRCRLTLSNHR